MQRGAVCRRTPPAGLEKMVCGAACRPAHGHRLDQRLTTDVTFGRGQGIHRFGSEIGPFSLEAAAMVTDRSGGVAAISAGDVVVAKVGEKHGVFNNDDRPLIFISVTSSDKAEFELVWQWLRPRASFFRRQQDGRCRHYMPQTTTREHLLNLTGQVRTASVCDCAFPPRSSTRGAL